MTEVAGVRELYKGWLNLLMVRLREADGDEFERHVIELGKAVCVLPYNPEQGTALVVSMPRAPVTYLGSPNMLEAIAGKLDAELPDNCARREALEEAGVQLTELYHIGCIWPMPSNATEQIDYYLAPYRAGDRVHAGGGLVQEQEHITVHEIKLLDLWGMYRQKKLFDGKLVTLVLALKLEHPELFTP